MKCAESGMGVRRRTFLECSVAAAGAALFPDVPASRLAAATGNGTIATVAGGGEVRTGPATQVAIGSPVALAVDAADNLYVCDNTYHRIYKVTSAGILTTVAGSGIPGYKGNGGPAITATLSFPYGIACNASGSLCIADSENARVRWVDPAGVITTIAGDGSDVNDGIPAAQSRLYGPNGVALDAGDNVYIADTESHRLRFINRSAQPVTIYSESSTPIVVPPGYITTIAGNGVGGFSGDEGPATSSQLNMPWGAAFDRGGNIYIADYYNHRIRRVAADTGIIRTVIGTGVPGNTGDGGPANLAALSHPCSVAFDRQDNLYIGQQQTSTVRMVNSQTKIISTVAGLGGLGEGGDGGPAVNAKLSSPAGVAVDSLGNLYIAEENNARVRRVDVVTKIISTWAGGSLNVGNNGPAVDAQLSSPCGFCFVQEDQMILSDQQNHIIRAVSRNGIIYRIAGTGVSGYNGDGIPSRDAKLAIPSDVQADARGNLYICDRGNQRIRKIEPLNTIISTVAGTGVQGYAGDGGPATSARLSEPRAIILDAAGNLYIAELYNQRIRFVNLGPSRVTLYAGSPNAITVNPGVIVTVAGTGVSNSTGDGGPAVQAAINSPRGVAVDSAGNLYLSEGGRDQQNIPPPGIKPSSKIRKIDARTGIISTVAGTGEPGYNGDNVPAISAKLNGPRNMTVDLAGNLYIADTLNNRVRLVNAQSGIITTFMGGSAFGFSGDGGPVAQARICEPRYVGLDSKGNLYLSDDGNSRIRKVTNP